MDEDKKIPEKSPGNESKQSDPTSADPKSWRERDAPIESRPGSAAPRIQENQAAAAPMPMVVIDPALTSAPSPAQTPAPASVAAGATPLPRPNPAVEAAPVAVSKFVDRHAVSTPGEEDRTRPETPAPAQSPAQAVQASMQTQAGLKPAAQTAVPIDDPANDPTASRRSVPAPSMLQEVAAAAAKHESNEIGVPHRPSEDIEVFSDEEAERRIRAKSRRGFLWGAAAVAGAWAGLEWLGTRRTDRTIPWPFRRLLEVNENLSRDLFSGARLAPEYPKDAARMPRPNGSYGVAEEENPDWELRLVGLADMSAAKLPDEAAASGDEKAMPEPVDKKAPPADKKGGAKPPEDKKGGARPPVTVAQDAPSESSDVSGASASPTAVKEPAVVVTMNEIRALPRTEIVTELKCIEGWSTVVHWTGVRLVDFMRKFPPATKSGDAFDPKRIDDLPEYVSMETPDGVYFVGLDMPSALHPQTILCYEMNGKPLALDHGAPLRLAIPVKYGIKNIKNIGKIKFTDERPKDYWAELGYDWYAGH